MTTEAAAFKQVFLKGVIRVVVFGLCLALCAGLMWLGGINWGERRPIVGVLALASIWGSAVTTALFTGGVA